MIETRILHCPHCHEPIEIPVDQTTYLHVPEIDAAIGKTMFGAHPNASSSAPVVCVDCGSTNQFRCPYYWSGLHRFSQAELRNAGDRKIPWPEPEPLPTEPDPRLVSYVETAYGEPTTRLGRILRWLGI